MSKVDDNTGRIAPPPTNFIRRLKNQILNELLPDTRSMADSRRSAREVALRDRMDDVDVGCIITNVHRHSDQMAHWVNAQQSDPSLGSDVVSRHASSSRGG
jgi:hypothetical protein